ncbi:c-type cytochrome [Immundisolibacter sp.]|jgi:cytochrome c556|uniref:c-type cytochrome n=1 Tax=Immundisolibacter sp. TaxID=1934948 RepID=UPI0019CBA48C|nr:cytochrome c [Immundisolibacter sp.]MBC7161382.1 cytochrome c [Immundisolibacter sp.]MEA3220921.1 Cytochrome c' [Immundisolibacter sp.]
MKRQTALSCAAVLFTVTAVAHGAAEPTPAERAVGYRQAVFHVIAGNFGPMAGMVKGEIPFDAKAFALRAERVAFLSTLPLEGFIPDSRVGKTEAKQEIWDNMDDFKAKMETFQTEAAKLAEAAKTASAVDALKPQFGKVGQACKDCHDKYKED